jgi:hypothetical protein
MIWGYLWAVVMESSIFRDVTLCSPVKSQADVSEEHVASIFKVEQ